MKYYFFLFVLIVLTAFSCSKSNDDVFKLQKDTPGYEFALELSKKLPSLDPDKNNVIVSTNDFKITTGEVIDNILTNSGNRTSHFKNVNADQLKIRIEKTAVGLAEKNLLLNAARKAKVEIPQAKVDSVLQFQVNRMGGEQKFNEYITKNGKTIDFVKDDIRTHMTITGYLDDHLGKSIQVTDEDIQQEYQHDKTATVRHILLMTQGKSDSAKAEIRKQMEDILAQAKSGADFAELAKKYTEDPGSKANGGLYENFGKGRMVKPFEDAAFNVPIGEISDIVETRYGYHILKVIDRKKETQPLEKVRSQIAKKLKTSKKREAYTNFIAQLKEDASFQLIEL